MLEKTTLNLKDSFKNPFSEYNANVMDPKTILSYWCNPFNFRQFAEVMESEVYSDKMPIVFKGGRGTGKTMFLKYLSYPVQIQEANANNANKISIISHLKEKGGIGFYIRIDGPKLRSFEGLDLKPEIWDFIFTHYFELVVCREYIDVISDLIKKNVLDEKEINNNFIPKIAKILGKSKKEFNNINDILVDLDNKIQEVTDFRSNIRISNIQFQPSKVFLSQSLSFETPKIAKETISEFDEDISFIILIDEYENFNEQQQRMVNTLLKFIKPGITFRIGMRLEGFRTYHTISKDDFIKEGRDYREIVYKEMLMKDRGYQSFLKDVAKKRLEKIKIFKEKGFLDISDFLGKSENLLNESIDLVRNYPDKHFNLLNNLSSEEIKLIKNRENPLLEMLNILWVSRGIKVKKINKVMNNYLEGKKTEDVKKYKRDYVDKYKLSLMFLLASVYRKNKMYYSFNTFSFLSSGIVGHFIELCRESFGYAVFEDKDKLLTQGKISKNAQDKAALTVANKELQQIQRIEDYGNYLYRFIKNLGNMFRVFHKDKMIRYPETNQFTVDIGALEKKIRDAFSAAVKWSVIQKKPSLQQPAPGKDIKDIYTINRIFSPSFGISYRTRGGYSVEFSSSKIEEFMTKEDVKFILNRNKSKLKELKQDNNFQQQTFKF